MKRLLWLPVFVVMSSPAWAQEGEEIVGFKYRPWLATLSGTLRADGSTLSGSNINVQSDLGFHNSIFHDFSGWINVPLIVIDRINVEYWFGRFSQNTTTAQSFTFGDNVVPAGTNIDSELDIQVGTLTLEKFLFKPGGDNLGVAFGIELGAKYFDVSASISSSASGFSDTESVKDPAPIVGAHLIINATAWFRFEAELEGIGGRYGGLQATYFEGFAEADFAPVKYFFIGVGYKFVSADVQSTSGNTFEVNVRLQGFFLSAGFRY